MKHNIGKYLMLNEYIIFNINTKTYKYINIK